MRYSLLNGQIRATVSIGGLNKSILYLGDEKKKKGAVYARHLSQDIAAN
jgi:hypothetical protein